MQEEKITFNRLNLVCMPVNEIIDRIKEFFPCPDLIVFEGIDIAFSCGCFVINLDQMSSGSFVYTVATGNFKNNYVVVRSPKSMPLENALLEVKEFLTEQHKAIAKTLGE
jgi:hypothetical protein